MVIGCTCVVSPASQDVVFGGVGGVSGLKLMSGSFTSFGRLGLWQAGATANSLTSRSAGDPGATPEGHEVVSRSPPTRVDGAD